MNRLLIIAIILIFVHYPAGAQKQNEYTFEFVDLRGKGVEGLYVSAEGASVGVTNGQGIVRLNFPQKEPGAAVVLHIDSDKNYTFRYPSAAEILLPSSRRYRPFTVWTYEELCQEKQFMSETMFLPTLKILNEKILNVESQADRERRDKIRLAEENERLRIDSVRQNVDLKKLMLEQQSKIEELSEENRKLRLGHDRLKTAYIEDNLVRKAQQISGSAAETIISIDSLNATPEQLSILRNYRQGDYTAVLMALQELNRMISFYDELLSGRETKLENGSTLKISPLIQFRALIGSIDSSSYRTWMLPRVRIKVTGHGANPSFRYLLQIAVVPRDHSGELGVHDSYFIPILDAQLTKGITRKLSASVGIAKLPGNRERMTDVRNIQFMDRSIVDSLFTLDRDLSAQLHYNLNRLKFYLALSDGNGRWFRLPRGGGSLTGRMEYSPLGPFDDFIQSDVSRTPIPDVSFGLAYSYNLRGSRQGGERGYVSGIWPDTLFRTNFRTLFLDCIFKYEGFSVSSEYIYRVNDASDPRWNVGFRTGHGFNVQAAYGKTNILEWLFRYSQIKPRNEASSFTERQDYTVGINCNLAGRTVKLQSDYTIAIQPGMSRRHTLRLQLAYTL